MNGFTLRLENLDGRDMPSATWAAGMVSESVAVHVAEMDQVSVQRNGGLAGGVGGDSVSVQRIGGLAGGIGGDSAVRIGGLAGGIEGRDRSGGSDGAVILGGLAGSIEGTYRSDGAVVAGGLTGGVVGSYGLDGGVVLGGLDGGVVLGGLYGGVVLGSPGDRFAPIDVDGSGPVEISRKVGEEIPSTESRALAGEQPGEEIPTITSRGEEIATF